MEIKEKLLSIFKADKKVRILLIFALVGVLLTGFSDIIPQTNKSTKNDDIKSTYTKNLENKTENIIGSINGVGKCKVMITIESTNETVYAQNSDITENNGSYSKKYEYVFYDTNNGDEPVLIKEYTPKIQGVAVVCEGGEIPQVKENVLSAISSLFGISTSKISISKLG